MRKEDKRKLSVRLTDRTNVGGEIESRLGISLPNLHALDRAIRDDLSEAPPYGIAWWSEDSPAGRAQRILISGYMISSLSGVTHHLLVARLAWLEFLDAEEAENALFDRTTVVEPSGRVRFSRPASPLDSLHLASARVEMHLGSGIVSLWSALDCLAAVIIVIAALAMDVRTASFRGVQKALEKIASATQNTTEVEEMQRAVWRDMEKAREECGLEGWMEWMRLYRNLLIHRGRAMAFEQVVPDSLLVGADGLPFRWKTQMHLSKYPALSYVEAELASDKFGSGLLEEHAGATFARLINGVTALVDHMAATLFTIWVQRRQSSTDPGQPAEQWKRAKMTDFVQQSLAELDPALITASIRDRKVFRAAALADDQRDVWSEPDMEEFVPKLTENEE